MDSPFDIQVYDKSFARVGVVRAPVAASFTVRFNGLGVASLELFQGDPAREWLDVPGARIRVLYRGEHLFSGPVRARSGPLALGNAVYEFEDDWRVLRNLGWVVPGGNLAPGSLSDEAQSYIATTNAAGIAEGSPYANHTATSAESTVKDLISANLVTRLGLPLGVVASQSRGGNAKAAGMQPRVRFDPIDEAVAELLAWSGMGLKVWHGGGAQLTADMWVPAAWPQVLTPESGIVVAGQWSLQYPTATRVIVGGPGEDVSRAFWGVSDTTGLEALYGDKIEVFRDSTGGSLKWGTTPDANQAAKYYLLRSEVAQADKDEFTSQLNAAGRKGLSEGAPTSGLSAELSETESFHFAGSDGIHLGDTVSIKADGVTFTNRVTECELNFDTGSGLVVTPQVGERRDDPDRVLADAIRKIAAAQRRMSSGK